METKFDFNKIKYGDIIGVSTKNEPISDIFVFDRVENGLIKFICRYDVINDQFSYLDAVKCHLGPANADDDFFSYRKASLGEEIILERAMSIRGYFLDENEKTGKITVKREDGHVKGKPYVNSSEIESGYMMIHDLNGNQFHIIQDIIESWNRNK